MHATRNPIVEEDLKSITASSLPWDRLFGKTALITGANGFIAAYMIETLLYLNETANAGIHVVALARNHEKVSRKLSRHLSRPDLTIVVQDVRAPYCGPSQVDFLIHAASQASPKYFSRDPVGTFEANVVGTQRMLELARNAKSESLLFFSSGEVYGQPDPELQVIDETAYGYLDPLNLRSCYAEGKRAGEALCAYWHAQFGVPAKIVRLSHTYGPGMELNDGRVFADFVADIVAGRDIVLKSDGSARRPFCYLADATVAFFIILLRGQSGQAYNVGSDRQCSILELAETLCRLFPERSCRVMRQHRVSTDPYLASPNPGFQFDLSSVRSLGWAPTTSIEEGFKRTIQSYQ
jgi:nucleoside-diphosphate-sugar epimerase